MSSIVGCAAKVPFQKLVDHCAGTRGGLNRAVAQEAAGSRAGATHTQHMGEPGEKPHHGCTTIGNRADRLRQSPSRSR